MVNAAMVARLVAREKVVDKIADWRIVMSLSCYVSIILRFVLS